MEERLLRLINLGLLGIAQPAEKMRVALIQRSLTSERGILDNTIIPNACNNIIRNIVNKNVFCVEKIPTDACTHHSAKMLENERELFATGEMK